MVYVFCAFYGECSDLIKHYNLKKRQSDKHYRFDVFENEVSPVKIIITGQGAVLAASAVSGAVSYFGIDGKDAIINIGTCAGNYELGSVFLCNKITEYVTGRTFYPDMLIKSSIREGEIVTVSVPVKENDIALGKLYDMEASAIYQAANIYVGPHRMVFVKVVSDNGNYDNLTPAMVKAIMADATDAIVQYVDDFVEVEVLSGSLDATDSIYDTDKMYSNKYENTSESLGCQRIEYDESYVNQLCADLHCSKSMENQVEQLIKYLSLEGTDYKTYIDGLYQEGRIPAHDKKNGKVCLDEIKGALL